METTNVAMQVVIATIKEEVNDTCVRVLKKNERGQRGKELGYTNWMIALKAEARAICRIPDDSPATKFITMLDHLIKFNKLLTNMGEPKVDLRSVTKFIMSGMVVRNHIADYFEERDVISLIDMLDQMGIK